MQLPVYFQLLAFLVERDWLFGQGIEDERFGRKSR